MNRRNVIKALVGAAVAIHALPLLEKVSELLPDIVRADLKEETRLAYYSRANLDVLKQHLQCAEIESLRPLPMVTGKTIRFYRYEGGE